MKTPLKSTDSLSFFRMLKSNLFHLQNRKIKSAASSARKPIVKGTGKSICRPNAPEVLIKSMARFNSSKCLCDSFKLLV